MDRLRQAVLAAARHPAGVEVDLTAVTFIDSTGFAELAQLAIRATGPVTFVRPSPGVRFMLEVAGLNNDVVHIDDHS